MPPRSKQKAPRESERERSREEEPLLLCTPPRSGGIRGTDGGGSANDLNAIVAAAEEAKAEDGKDDDDKFKEEKEQDEERENEGGGEASECQTSMNTGTKKTPTKVTKKSANNDRSPDDAKPPAGKRSTSKKSGGGNSDDQISSHPKPVKNPLLPMSAIINFLDIDNLRNVRLASRETNVAAMDVLKLKHKNCKTMVLQKAPRMNNRLKFLVSSGILKSQKKLVIDCGDFDDLTADGFAYLTGLDQKAIVLRRMTSIPNNCLDYLAQMKSLKSVSIVNDCFGDETEISIAHATRVLCHLEELSLDCNCCLVIDDFVHLGRMHALKSLTLWWCAPGRCLEHITSSVGERLESLDIQFTSGVSDDDMQTIAGMRSLRSLKFESDRSVDLSPLTGLENLDILDINFTINERVSDDDMWTIAGMRSLRSLKLGCDLLVHVRPNLSPLTGLENLIILHINLTITEQFLIDVGRSMHSLRDLVLGNCTLIQDEELWHLGSLQALEMLKICYLHKLTGTGLAHLHHLTSLKILSLLYCTKLVDKDIKEIVRNVPSLRRVYIFDCKKISSTIRDGLFCPGVIIKVDDEFSEEEREKWGY